MTPDQVEAMSDAKLHVASLIEQTPQLRGQSTAVPLLIQSTLVHCKNRLNPMHVRPMVMVAVHGRRALPIMLDFMTSEAESMREHLQDADDVNMLDKALASIRTVLRLSTVYAESREEG